MERRHTERFLEFLVIGVVMGVAEDLLAVKLATGAPLDLSVLWIVVAVAVPFAAVSELLVDREESTLFRDVAEKLHRGG
ncbi:MAG: hypothetical protein SVW77_00380 [Candidatus Nanohaloarchaea archaeon]|nr:hypothetical protein [Candidatus Nanohaloarchaea archaeon]